jgi:phage tail-like protein
MRGALPELVNPLPMTNLVPAMLRDDEVARAICAGLDGLIAPVLLTLDDFTAYLDLSTAPEDLLPWLAQWVGMAVDPGEDLDRQRTLLASANQLHVMRGTRRGIQLAVEAALGVPAEVIETGGAAWSAEPGGTLPGDARPTVTVVVRPPAGQYVDADRLDALVTSLKPAHVAHRVQVSGG